MTRGSLPGHTNREQHRCQPEKPTSTGDGRSHASRDRCKSPPRGRPHVSGGLISLSRHSLSICFVLSIQEAGEKTRRPCTGAASTQWKQDTQKIYNAGLGRRRERSTHRKDGRLQPLGQIRFWVNKHPSKRATHRCLHPGLPLQCRTELRRGSRAFGPAEPATLTVPPSHRAV